jgi:hypothetical protein
MIRFGEFSADGSLLLLGLETAELLKDDTAMSSHNFLAVIFKPSVRPLPFPRTVHTLSNIIVI